MTQQKARKETTELAAPRLTVKPQTMRAGYCRHGHYLGMIPVKLPNGRLLWDSNQIDRLIAGEVIL